MAVFIGLLGYGFGFSRVQFLAIVAGLLCCQ